MLVCKRWSKVTQKMLKEYLRGESKTLPKAGFMAPRSDLGPDGYNRATHSTEREDSTAIKQARSVSV